MKSKKIAGLILCLLLMLALPVAASAETLKTEDFTMELPAELMKFDRKTPVDDPAWALAGIADPAKTLEQYDERSTVCHLVSPGGDMQIMVMQKQNDYSKKVFNLSDLDKQVQDEIISNIMGSKDEAITVKNTAYPVGDKVFYRVQLDGTTEQGEMHEVLYGTFINGYALNFDLYTGKNAATPEQEALLTNMLKSLTFTNILPTPANAGTGLSPVLSFSLLGVLVLIIVTPFIYIPLRNRYEKRRKVKLASQLEEYRHTHGDGASGPLRFANTTDCTREAIHTFSRYHAYGKNIASVIVGAILSLGMVAVAFLLNTEWWMKMAAVAVAGYYGYRIVTTPTTLEKIQRRVYDRGSSSTAIYAFYDEAFRVSGIQSATMIPYFQLTAVKKHNHYVYLYYGPDNAYMVHEFGFEKGSFEEFKTFIAEKTGKKL